MDAAPRTRLPFFLFKLTCGLFCALVAGTTFVVVLRSYPEELARLRYAVAGLDYDQAKAEEVEEEILHRMLARATANLKKAREACR